jgi:hypothetical protein
MKRKIAEAHAHCRRLLPRFARILKLDLRVPTGVRSMPFPPAGGRLQPVAGVDCGVRMAGAQWGEML